MTAIDKLLAEMSANGTHCDPAEIIKAVELPDRFEFVYHSPGDGKYAAATWQRGEDPAYLYGEEHIISESLAEVLRLFNEMFPQTA